MRISAQAIALFGAAALALANLGRIPAGMLAGRNAPITIADFAALLVWAALATGLLTRRLRFVVDGVTSAAAMFVGLATISTAFALRRYGFSFEIVAFLARWVLYFGWYPFVALCLTSDESRKANGYVDRALLFICVFGIFQSLVLGEFAGMLPAIGDAPVWEYQGRRLVSTLMDPNFAGAMIVLGLLPRLARVAEGEREAAWVLIVMAAGLALTASRSSILALGAGISVLFLARGIRWPLVKTLGVGALLALPALPLLITFGESMNKFTVDASAAQRLVTWQRAFTLFSEHPWIGIGFNATRQAQLQRGWRFIGGGDTAFDGGLLFVMVMTGVIGVTLYVLMLSRAVLAARRVWRDDSLSPDDRAHASGTAASVVAIVLHALFSGSLLLPFVMQVLWIRFGRLAHLTAERRRRLGLMVAAPLVVATACSPCFGTIACETSYFMRLQGKIVDHQTGAPAPGTVVRVVFSGAEQNTIRMDTTGSDGQWEVEAPTSCCDRVRVQASVRAPGNPEYLVPDFDAIPSTTAGNAQNVGRWLTRPYVRYGFLLRYQGVPMANVPAAFQAVGGVPFTPRRVETVTGSDGILRFDAESDRVGEIVGTLSVTHPSLGGTWRMPGHLVLVTNVANPVRIADIEVYNRALGAAARP